MGVTSPPLQTCVSCLQICMQNRSTNLHPRVTICHVSLNNVLLPTFLWTVRIADVPFIYLSDLTFFNLPIACGSSRLFIPARKNTRFCVLQGDKTMQRFVDDALAVTKEWVPPLCSILGFITACLVIFLWSLISNKLREWFL